MCPYKKVLLYTITGEKVHSALLNSFASPLLTMLGVML